MGVAQKDILNGWKEIAGYVARDIRTVERWEKTRGLPVRRVPGAGRATVFARISELEEWMASKPLESEMLGSLAETASTEPDETVASLTSQPTRIEEPFTHPAALPASEPARLTVSRRWLYAAGAAACVLLVATFSLFHHTHAVAEAQASVIKPPVAATLRHSAVPGVEESYLRGSYLVEQRTPESLAQALESFQSAIQHDPNYAPAYAGLASTYNLLREYSIMPDTEAFPKARAAAERAIALDPKLAEPYVSLAFVTYYWYMDSAKAELEFKTAIELDPTLSQAHHWYGSVLTHEGRFDEAIHELNLAQHEEPASSAILTSRAFALGVSGHSEQARAMLRDLLSHNGFGKDPNSATAHLVLGIVNLAAPRDWNASFAQWREVGALRQKDHALLGYLDAIEPAYKAGGEKALFEASLAYDRKSHPRPEDVTLRMVESETNLGQLDQAFSDLDRIAARDSTSLCGISLDPLLQPLRGDPRFAQFRARLGLPKLNA